MVKRVWKELKLDDLGVVTDHLEAMPEEQRPLYGLVGVKTSLWSQMGGGAKPFVVLIMPDRIVLSKRSVTGKKETWRKETPLSGLVDVSVRRGPMLDSAQLTFDDGYRVRVGNVPHTQIDPVTGAVERGAVALDWDELTSVQKTNCYYAFTMMELLPRDLL